MSSNATHFFWLAILYINSTMTGLNFVAGNGGLAGLGAGAVILAALWLHKSIQQED